MSKCDFNKVSLQLFLNLTLICAFSCKIAVYFQSTFDTSLMIRILLERLFCNRDYNAFNLLELFDILVFINAKLLTKRILSYFISIYLICTYVHMYLVYVTQMH